MKERLKRNPRRVILLLVALGLLLGLLLYHNGHIVITELALGTSRVPEGFVGCRFVQASDLHNNLFGQGQARLLEKLQEAKPDYIFLTGDMIDREPMENALLFVAGAAKIAPVYYVSGNHEYYCGVYGEFTAKLEEAGAVVLENEMILLSREGDEIALIGLADPLSYGNNSEIFEDTLNGLCAEAGDRFTIVLCHRPEKAEGYADAQADLVFTGHVHGGGIRLPFVGAIFAPDQGWIPPYSAGMYEIENTHMVVNRGLGHGKIPYRVNNPPELVAVTLQ